MRHSSPLPAHKKSAQKELLRSSCALLSCLVKRSLGYGYFFPLSATLRLLGFDNRFRFGYRLGFLGFLGVLCLGCPLWLWLGCLGILWLRFPFRLRLAFTCQHGHDHQLITINGKQDWRLAVGELEVRHATAGFQGFG